MMAGEGVGSASEKSSGAGDDDEKMGLYVKESWKGDPPSLVKEEI
jgi:hypothetical protein